jgi:PAS domain S-box-containing protein
MVAVLRNSPLSLLVFLFLLSNPCASVGQVQSVDVSGTKNVLILHAFESNVPIFELTDRGIRTTLDAGGVGIRNQFFEYLDLARNPGPEHRERLVELMRLRYGQRAIHAIVTMYPEALHFVLQEGQRIFPGVPVLALYLPQGFELPKTDRRVIGHTGAADIVGTVELALKLAPRAKRLYIVTGSHKVDRGLEEKARRDLKKWEGRLEFRSLSVMPFEEILTAVSSAHPENIVLLLGVAADATGKTYTTREVATKLGAISKAPVFGLYDVALGHGIAGGSLISFERNGANAGQLILDILRGGVNLNLLPATLDVASVPMFDWQQLKRWNLSLNSLPPGSIIINREYTLWERYRWEAISAAVLLMAQGVLILALLVHRQRRRKAEETLRENEERLRLAMSAASLGVWSWDIRRDRIQASELIGSNAVETPRPELTYKEVLAVVHPEDRARIDATIQRAIRSGEEYEVEYRVLQPDGTVQWISSRGSCSYDRAGAPLRMTGISQDTTDRKRAEMALQESEQRFRRMTDAAHMMVWMSGLDKKCAFFNQSWLDFTGRRLEQELGDGWTEGVHPEDLERVVSVYSQAFDARQPFELDYRLRRHDGQYRWIVDVGTPLYENDGRFCGYLGSCLDITDRKRAEEERQLLAAVVESSHDAILSLDLNAHITSWNPGAERLFGYLSAEVKGQPVWFLVPPEARETTARVLERVKAGEAIAWEAVRCRKDGTHVQVAITWAPLRNAAGEIVGLSTTLRDVTERKRAEEEAERLRRDLAHMSRVTMLGELTAALAHELNQPLTAIVSNAHAGERYLASPAPPLGEVAEILADVVADAQRAGEVIRRLRSLLKKDTTRFVPLDVNELIREVVALTQTDALIRHQPITLTLTPDLPPVRGDRVQLQQVLLNLVLNGMEAMEAASPAARQLGIETLHTGSDVRVGVQDQGPGIPPDKLDTIFDTFFTTKASGIGMGLAISRSIVEAHGGRIWAENHPDRGAAFWFSLPV